MTPIPVESTFYIRLAEHEVGKMARDHLEMWADEDDRYWFLCLSEEIGELASSLAGRHRHIPEWELTQIASICLNWLAKRKKESDNA